MFDDLKGKVVVVTGGVTGIGGAASLAFAEAGASLPLIKSTPAYPIWTRASRLDVCSSDPSSPASPYNVSLPKPDRKSVV